MERHEPLLPRELHHYDLHVWLWKDNPIRIFDATNPGVACEGKHGYPLLKRLPKRGALASVGIRNGRDTAAV
ncbi:MAG TPA: hypothetical protein VN240_03470 [Propylenella sp.]|nr:hypothetical protein [Propylenella sp.]